MEEEARKRRRVSPQRFEKGSCRSVDCFERIYQIGSGTYGTVYKARDRATDDIVALKKVILHNEKQDGFPLTSLREIRTLKHLSHPNIVELKEIVVGDDRDSVYLVFEYCENDLACVIDSRPSTFSESEIKCIMQQLLKSIAHAHDNWVIHRDLKMSNLLYHKGKVKLADFGLARFYTYPESNYTCKVVTLWYRAPELLLGGKSYDTSLDMWSVGCIFGELLLGRPLFPGTTEASQIKLIFQMLGAPSKDIWPDYPFYPNVARLNFDASRYTHNNLKQKFPKISHRGLDLLNSFLIYDPKKRITAHEALRHPYFKEYPDPKPISKMPSHPQKSNDRALGGRRRPRRPSPEDLEMSEREPSGSRSTKVAGPLPPRRKW